LAFAASIFAEHCVATDDPASRKSRMNLRHAAALALLGWYLMMPPVSADRDRAFVYSQAPIGRWQIRGTFGSTIDCEKAKGKSQKKWRDDEERNAETAARMDANLNDLAIGTFEAARLMKCVSTDDPRPQGKVG
jgi:hypothetical protein